METLNLESIKKPIEAEMREFETKFRESMRSKVSLLDKIMHYIVKRKGKQMRPMFVFLSAGLYGSVTESTYRGASLIELLHTATLVHDDIVDDSNLRRGFFSVNALWKNKIAVLVGDYLLSRGLLLAVSNGDFQLLEIVSKAVKDMSEGELLQIEKARKLDIDEQVYYDIIRQKTATLISACCAVGAASAGADEKGIELMSSFGRQVGIAFQIKDDLFDFELDNKTGKPAAIDIRESKMTLPLIYALSRSTSDEKKRIINIIKKHSTRESEIKNVLEFVNEKEGIEYARKKMYEFRDDALSIIAPISDGIYKNSLSELVHFTIERNR